MAKPIPGNDAVKRNPTSPRSQERSPASGAGDARILVALALAGLVILAGILTDHIPGLGRPSLPPLGSVRSKPSFDCSSAYEWVERAICSDLTLAALDNQNAALYQQRMNEMNPREREDLAKGEAGWVEQRNDCESKPNPLDCIAQAYRKRISELSQAH